MLILYTLYINFKILPGIILKANKDILSNGLTTRVVNLRLHKSGRAVRARDFSWAGPGQARRFTTLLTTLIIQEFL